MDKSGAFKIELRKLLKDADRKDLWFKCLEEPLVEEEDATKLVARMIELVPVFTRRVIKVPTNKDGSEISF